MKFKTNQPPAAPPKVRVPQSPQEWASLMEATVRRARQVAPGQLPGLLHAQANQQGEAHLRRLGIVHLGDLDREMPLPG